MPHLEDAFFGRTEHLDRRFNDEHTLENALDVLRDIAIDHAESETGRQQKTLFACVRLYEEPFIASYETPSITMKEGIPQLVHLPVKKIIPKDVDKEPTFFFALGNPFDLSQQMYYVIGEIERNSGNVNKLDIHQTSRNGVNGSVDQWVNTLIIGYKQLSGTLNRTIRTLTDTGFENFYLTYFKDEYYLSIGVKNDPLVKKLHVRPDGTMAYNTKERAHISLF